MPHESRPGGSHERLLVNSFGVEYSLPKEGAEPGRKNEDVTLADDKAMVYAVFDGAGGHNEPYVASSMAAEVVRANLRGAPRVTTFTEALDSTRMVLLAAHDELTTYSAHTYRKHPGAWPRTTGVVLRIFETPDGKKRGVVAHCGDSRLYRFRRVWSEVARTDVVTIEQLTLDHSPGNTWDNQRLFARISSRKEMKGLTPGQLSQFNNNYTITEALGAPGKAPDIRVGRLGMRDGDVLLLTTDGIHDNVPDYEMCRIFETYEDVGEGLAILARQARALSRLDRKVYPRSKPDDMSGVAVVVRFAPETSA